MKEYSNDSGKTWEGPFSDDEIRNLTACGVVNPSTLIRECGAANTAAASVPSPSPQNGAAPEGYYVSLPGGQPQGPFSIEQIRQQLACGALSPTAQAWKQGWKGWIPIMDLFAVPQGLENAKGSGIGDILADMVGTQRVRSLHLKDFFSEVFKHHQPREMEAFFCSGGPYSTPILNEAPMPRPWIYTRVLGFFAILFAASLLLCLYHEILGGLFIIITLNFAVPFSMLVLFAEVNVARDVSWFKILQMFFIGGICSLLFTFLINDHTGQYEAYWAGPVEETAKLAACLVVAGARIRKGGILQGLLCGAAVGAGFAIPESIMYFFKTTFETESLLVELVQNGQLQLTQAEAEEIIGYKALLNSCHRAVLSPIGHMLYTPIVAAAAWRLMQGKEFSLQILNNFQFYRLALVGVLLHSFWNAPILGAGDEFVVKIGIVTVIGWTVVFLLLREGVAKLKGWDNLTQNPNL